VDEEVNYLVVGAASLVLEWCTVLVLVLGLLLDLLDVYAYLRYDLRCT
jgi:hypothetical protein